MKYEEYLKEALNKHPFILKSLKRMKGIEHVEEKYIKHFCAIINTNHFELKRTKIAYNNYTDFFELYDTVTRLTNIEPLYIRFQDLKNDDKEIYLADRDIPYGKTEQGYLIIRSENYETTKLLGAKSWCIQKNREDWEIYNDNRKHLIITSDIEMYGLSYNKEVFDCFDINNNPVDLSDIKSIIPEHYGLNNIKSTSVSDVGYSFSMINIISGFLILSVVFEFFIMDSLTSNLNIFYLEKVFWKFFLLFGYFFIFEIFPRLIFILINPNTIYSILIMDNFRQNELNKHYYSYLMSVFSKRFEYLTLMGLFLFIHFEPIKFLMLYVFNEPEQYWQFFSKL